LYYELCAIYRYFYVLLGYSPIPFSEYGWG
jgi:hypothetical protein